MKLSFLPAILYVALELRFFGRTIGNFYAAKATGIFLMPLTIVDLFYLYRAFIEENLALDILIFIVAVAIGQLTGYKLMMWRPIPQVYQKISIAGLILLAALFIVFTFQPPRLPIFMDPLSGG